MNDAEKQNTAWARFMAIRDHPPSSWDESAVADFHGIVTALEEAHHGIDLSAFRVPDTRERVPTEREVIDMVRERNALLRSTIINNQLQDCLARGTWACTFNNDTNINVVISQK
jgi:hypothetical protein